ncbi:glycosyltransferase [Pelagibacteraceae bacterium]|jgi:glycosyltransferase involved in cell wall biosynthesis|nr:glycosyltransferase [Pelagibacteraceae bacterium]|tara:strand:- start:7696 stop:9828 length:2133 start_codon:yes stop_codon:yes gene_type:complete
MKISILLPYKENFSPIYPGAVSLFINETTKLSKYKKDITVYGNTDLKVLFKLNYLNIPLKKKILSSRSEKYVKEFLNIEKNNPSDLIEIHNRPNYLKLLINNLSKRTFTLYFHNDPLTMTGSKSISDRKYLLENCYKIIFNSYWSKKRFLEGLHGNFINSEKLLVVFQSAKKQSINFNKKEKLITFVGKLNKSKGYDIFGKTIIKILNNYKDWKAVVIGDEQRDKIIFNHPKLAKLGFLPHNKVLDYYKKTSIAVVCSRWEEPFGRTSLEASSNGCAVIISNRGGLPETVTNGIILDELSVENLYKNISLLIRNKKKRVNLQKLSNKNFYLTHNFVSRTIDNYRDNKLQPFKIFFTKKKNKKLRILHVTNFNERHDGRLYFNTGRRINNGFIREGHSILEISDRDIQKYYKNYKDINGSKTLNDKLKKTCYNYKPDLLVLGHADLISANSLGELKDDYPNLKVSQWFLDPLNKLGPDYERNKKRILDKIDHSEANFITTSPKVLDFLPSKSNNYFIPNPADPSIETLNNYEKNCNMDVFFALSHGVHRGVLKSGKFDERAIFINRLKEMTKNVKFDVYGFNNVQPIWADHYFQTIANSKMGLNLSRGEPIKYYSSDRITQIIGNGLVTLVDEKTLFRDFFNDNEMVFYKNINDLSEKIIKIANNEHIRKKIARNGKIKYLKYFNSSLVANYIIEKTFGIDSKNKYMWEKK